MSARLLICSKTHAQTKFAAAAASLMPCMCEKEGQKTQYMALGFALCDFNIYECIHISVQCEKPRA